MELNSTLNSTGNWLFIKPSNSEFINDMLLGYVVVLLGLAIIFCVVNRKCMKDDYKYVEHSGYLDCEEHPLYNSHVNGNYRSLDCGIINNSSYHSHRFNTNNTNKNTKRCCNNV
jgi:hypothetical protein